MHNLTQIISNSIQKLSPENAYIKFALPFSEQTIKNFDAIRVEPDFRSIYLECLFKDINSAKEQIIGSLKYYFSNLSRKNEELDLDDISNSIYDMYESFAESTPTIKLNYLWIQSYKQQNSDLGIHVDSGERIDSFLPRVLYTLKGKSSTLFPVQDSFQDRESFFNNESAYLESIDCNSRKYLSCIPKNNYITPKVGREATVDVAVPNPVTIYPSVHSGPGPTGGERILISLESSPCEANENRQCEFTTLNNPDYLGECSIFIPEIDLF